MDAITREDKLRLLEKEQDYYKTTLHFMEQEVMTEDGWTASKLFHTYDISRRTAFIFMNLLLIEKIKTPGNLDKRRMFA